MTSHPTRNSKFSPRRLGALCRKESYQIIRDPSSVLIAFILPIILMCIFGYGINLDASKMQIGLVNQDIGVESRDFTEVLVGSPYIDLTVCRDQNELMEKIKQEELRGGLVIKSDFSKQIGDQNAADLQILTDGAMPNVASFVQNYAEGALQVWLAQKSQDRGASTTSQIDFIPRFWYNPSTVSRNYIVPGSISVIMTVIGALLTSLVIAREWERGTWEALLSSPITRRELILSKILPYYVLGLVAMTMCVLAATLIMHVPLRGSILALFVVTTMFLGSSLGLGLMISTLTRNQFMASHFALNAGFLPATMLSGFAFEISSMPAPLRAFTYLIPARYFVSAQQTIFLAGDIWRVILPNLAALTVAAIFFLGITAKKLGRRLDD